MQEFRVEFTKAGQAFEAAQVEAVLSAVPVLTDLYVLCHGWNNDIADANELYDELLASIASVQSDGLVKGLEGRTFGAVRVYWPSKRFADADLIPGGGAASATAANDAALLAVLDQLASSPERLGGTGIDAAAASAIAEAKALVGKLESDESARKRFVELLSSVVDRDDAQADDGSADFFATDSETLFSELGQAVIAPAPTGGGGASSLGAAGGAAGLRDLLEGAKAAARRIANFITYYQMKNRAGVVGKLGVHELLRRVREKNPAVRLHLVGHSFGGRVITAAAHSLAPDTRAVTLSMLQAAYSHNGLGQQFDGKNDGFFRRIISERRASGPILITHTKNDGAVGVAYPLASRIARQKASFLGDENDPYGGMGRNGAQFTPEAKKLALGELGTKYTFAQNAVYNLKADSFIGGHSDVTGPQVAYAILHAVAAT